MRTKKLTLLYFFLISGLLFSSCNKDNSIKKQETVDSYQVQDSVLIAISQEWIHQSYIVKISKYSNQPEEITVKNLANNELTHSATSSNEAFIIPYQSLKDEYWFFC